MTIINTPTTSIPPSPLPPTSCSDFTVLKLLGTGGFAKVYLVQRLITGELFAMKVMNKVIRPKLTKSEKKRRALAITSSTTSNFQSSSSPSSITSTSNLLPKAKIYVDGMNEREILASINQHPFLVTLRYAFQDDYHLYLILDWAQGGELWDHVARQGVCLEDDVTFYIAEIILALEHLHSLHIIYRDLKLENVLLDESGHIKLTDFGLAKFAFVEDMQFRANSWRGTFGYMAPEMIQRKPYDERVDTWGVGILAYLMLTGTLPFDGKSNADVERAIISRKPKCPTYLTREACSFINWTLTKDPEKRPMMHELKTHPFFRKLKWTNEWTRINTKPPRLPSQEQINEEVQTLLHRMRRVQSVMAEGTVAHGAGQWGDLDHPIEEVDKVFRDFSYPKLE